MFFCLVIGGLVPNQNNCRKGNKCRQSQKRPRCCQNGQKEVAVLASNGTRQEWRHQQNISLAFRLKPSSLCVIHRTDPSDGPPRTLNSRDLIEPYGSSVAGGELRCLYEGWYVIMLDFSGSPSASIARKSAFNTHASLASPLLVDGRSVGWARWSTGARTGWMAMPKLRFAEQFARASSTERSKLCDDLLDNPVTLCSPCQGIQHRPPITTHNSKP
jgi:hypothetical protein